MSASEETPVEPRYTIIGPWTRYSSWTARVTVLLDYYSIPYKSDLRNIHAMNQTPEGYAEVGKLSPSRLFPILIDHSFNPPVRVNDSLAILLHLAEQHPDLPFFPSDPHLRAVARSAAAEMHSGFGALRNAFCCNFVAKYEGNIPVSEDAKKDVARIVEIWGQARKAVVERGVEDEGFLCGEFGVVDAFFWPVLWRFRTYGLLPADAAPEVKKWLETMWSDPKIEEVGRGYFKQVGDPGTRIEHYENVFRGVEGVECGVFEEDWAFQA